MHYENTSVILDNCRLILLFILYLFLIRKMQNKLHFYIEKAGV